MGSVEDLQSISPLRKTKPKRPRGKRLIYSYLPVIKAIHKEKDLKNRALLLDRINDESINFICSCVRKMLTGDIQISQKSNDILKEKLLAKTKNRFKVLSDDISDVAQKRKIIRQEGSGFGHLLETLVPTLAKLTNNFFHNKKRKKGTSKKKTPLTIKDNKSTSSTDSS